MKPEGVDVAAGSGRLSAPMCIMSVRPTDEVKGRSGEELMRRGSGEGGGGFSQLWQIHAQAAINGSFPSRVSAREAAWGVYWWGGRGGPWTKREEEGGRGVVDASLSRDFIGDMGATCNVWQKRAFGRLRYLLPVVCHSASSASCEDSVSLSFFSS